MSRIAGIYLKSGRSDHLPLLGKMLDVYDQTSRVLLKRETLISTNCALGWSGWQAPNVAQKGTWEVVLDGVVFNHREIGGVDSAVFAAVSEKHALPAALNSIDGEFAAAIYSPTENVLWLARDRFGIKPLYYVETAQFVAFASRPAPLFVLPGVSRELNRKFVATFAASHYRYFDNDPERSPYEAVRQVPAGSALRISASGTKLERWYALAEQAELEGSEDELAAQYRDLLFRAVSCRHVRASRPAFTLSGGMDSSSVLSSAVATSGKKQEAYSTVYLDKTYDESSDIQSMLQTQVSHWNQVEVGTPDVFQLVREMIALHDEPVATATWLSHYLLCRSASAAGKGSLFGGLGGDELNAGEYEYFFFFFADLRAKQQEAELKRETERWVEYHNHPIFQKSFGVMEEALSRMVDLRRPGLCLPDRRRSSRYLATLNPDYFDLRSMQPVMDHPFTSYLKNRTYQDIFRETAPCCLRAEDRHATAFGIENHLPFFDHHVVEFMFRIPGNLKIREGVTKYLLRLAMRGVLPEETRTRVKKTGWNAPAHRWFVEEPNRSQLLDLVRSQRFREAGIYNVAEVERIIREHEEIVSSLALKENHMMFLWQLVNLMLWV